MSINTTIVSNPNPNVVLRRVEYDYKEKTFTTLDSTIAAWEVKTEEDWCGSGESMSYCVPALVADFYEGRENVQLWFCSKNQNGLGGAFFDCIYDKTTSSYQGYGFSGTTKQAKEMLIDEFNKLKIDHDNVTKKA